jgi:hypothetical protein
MMFIERCRKYFARAVEISRIRSHRVTALRRSNDLDALRAGLKHANRCVADKERLVAGWRELIERDQPEGRDVSVARDLLNTFQIGLDVAMSNKWEAEKAVAQRLRDLFEGGRGRLPADDRELHAWLTSPEGKAATAF